MNEQAINNAAFFKRLADVELPPEPTIWPMIAVIVASAIVVAALLLRGYLRYFRKVETINAAPLQQQAIKRLAETEAAWCNQEIDARETAYRLSTLLRLGLGLPQLTEQCPQSLQEEASQWRQTIILFKQLRYRPANDQRLPDDIFEQLRHWLALNSSGTTDV